MLKFVFVALLVVMLAACTQADTSPSSVEPVIINVDNPSVRPQPDSNMPRLIEQELEGVRVGVWLPPGWQADESDARALTLVESMGSLDTDEPASGVRLSLFVPDLGAILPDVNRHDNIAHAALTAVVASREQVGGATTSAPQALEWEGRVAAYYLFSSETGEHGIVIGLALTDETPTLAVINISAPEPDSSRIEAMLPTLLGDLSIGGYTLDATFINALPSPLVFP
ncbi:MAG: hypothetical protein SF123_04865 [Chloroflexota bacterium]|nr:hypothetical protein [Chloroflexota bacterium]